MSDVNNSQQSHRQQQPSQQQSSQQANTHDLNDEQLQGYTLLKTLGKGNFGRVCLSMHILTGQYVAIKILQKDKIFEKADIQRISREIKIMKIIRHPNIVQLYQIIQKPKKLYLIMQYAEGGDLFDKIVKAEKLGEAVAGNYYAQIVLGLQYLHGKGIAHRDMKPENILISGSNKLKIADFGLGNFFAQNQLLKTACGSPCYASPQMLQRVPYDPQKIDIWSSGIILFAMLCGYLPFEDQVTTKLYQKIKNNNPKFPRHLSQQSKSILKRILDKNPLTRISIQQLKQQNWLKNQIQKQTAKQFQVDEQNLHKICQIYGIKQQQKLMNYLKKNKHNNLTTIYYLAMRGFKRDQQKGEKGIKKINEGGNKEKVKQNDKQKVRKQQDLPKQQQNSSQNSKQHSSQNSINSDILGSMSDNNHKQTNNNNEDKEKDNNSDSSHITSQPEFKQTHSEFQPAKPQNQPQVIDHSVIIHADTNAQNVNINDQKQYKKQHQQEKKQEHHQKLQNMSSHRSQKQQKNQYLPEQINQKSQKLKEMQKQTTKFPTNNDNNYEHSSNNSNVSRPRSQNQVSFGQLHSFGPINNSNNDKNENHINNNHNVQQKQNQHYNYHQKQQKQNPANHRQIQNSKVYIDISNNNVQNNKVSNNKPNTDINDGKLQSFNNQNNKNSNQNNQLDYTNNDINKSKGYKDLKNSVTNKQQMVDKYSKKLSSENQTEKYSPTKGKYSFVKKKTQTEEKDKLKEKQKTKQVKQIKQAKPEQKQTNSIKISKKQSINSQPSNPPKQSPQITKKQSQKIIPKQKQPIEKQQPFVSPSTNNMNKSLKIFPKTKQQKQKNSIKQDLNTSKDIAVDRKPKMIKMGRMQTIKSSTRQDINTSTNINNNNNNRKTPALYQRSHSRDKPLQTKKIIGKQIQNQPFLLDTNKIVLCPWPLFSSILTEKGAEGRIQYFSYGKNCIYIAKCNVKGLRSLRDIVEKINMGEIQ